MSSDKEATDLSHILEQKNKELEEKNRALELEASLNVVRSSALSMITSNDLSTTIAILFQELEKLGLKTIRCGIGIFNDDSNKVNVWTASEDQSEKVVNLSGDEYLEGHPLLNGIYSHWEKQQNFAYTLKGQDLIDYYSYTSKTNLPVSPPNNMDGEIVQYYYCVMFPAGGLFAFKDREFDKKSKLLMARFAEVFHFAFIRHQDLIKAEIQAKEALIETALERVRSRSLAMKYTSELQDVINTVHSQLINLELPITGGAFITINDDFQDQICCWGAGSTANYIEEVKIPFFPSPIYNGLLVGINNGPGFFTERYSNQEKLAFFQHLFKIEPYINTPLNRKKEILSRKGGYTRSCIVSKHTSIFIINHHGQEFTEDENNILKRFGLVFEQAYTRFLDLQRAEQQARTAEINLAVERVRAKAMAMHKSEEIINVVAKLKYEIMSLDIPDVIAATIFLNEGNDKVRMWDLSSLELDDDHKEVPFDITFKLKKHDPNLYMKKVWENEEDYFVVIQEEKGFKRLMEWLREHGKEDVAKEVEDFTEKTQLKRLYHTARALNNGKLVIDLLNPPSDEMKTILTKMGDAFDLTYTRFLDLKNAEAQTRKAQIETALERIRARSMAMNESDELNDVLSVLFKQFDVLDIKPVTAFLSLFDIKNNTFTYRSTSKAGTRMHTQQVVNLDSLDIWKDLVKKWQNDTVDSIEEIHYPKESIPELLELFKETFSAMPEEERITAEDFPNGGFAVHGYCKFGYLGFNHYRRATEEEKEILKTFSNEFSRVYQRFLDIKNAEAQSKENQIQLALERVRARTMAMQKSEELSETASVLFQQFNELGYEPERINIGIIKEDQGVIEFWSTEQGGKAISQIFKGSIEEPTTVKKFYKAWKKNEDSIVVDLYGEELKRWIKYVREDMQIPMKEDLITNQRFHSGAFFSQGLLIITNPEPIPNESFDILKRFASVFEQTYTRFLDLEKAEAQAREAIIEAALERVRSKAIAMRSSEDIGEAITILFEEIEKLGIESLRVGIGIIHDIKSMEAWTTTTTKGKNVVQITGQLDMTIHPLLTEVFNRWNNNDSYFSYNLEGRELQSYYKAVSNQTYSLPTSKEFKKTHFLNGFFFKKGAIYVFTKHSLNDEHIDIIKRFTKVFGLTYQRYRELIDSEIREREAKRQASLDRVRGEIASMRSTEDLNKITPIIWQELTNLGVPFFRCGVFIMDEEKNSTQVFLSDPNGKSLGLMTLDYQTNDLTNDTVNAWRKDEVFKGHWNKDEFIDWTNTLIKLGKIKTPKGYQGGDDAPESLDLHFVPFKQGMLYVGNLKPLNDDHLSLVSNIADSFSIAYARYEDFDKLEKAKEKVEKALKDLKETQKQLVQSEKMASLGELTAGIAHEIQNPLNFVNNFSEVSSELIEEIEDELKAGDINEVNAILNDIKENLLKINHHGKRADSIVKGMLQHSRESGGEKEIVDINQLVDEYLRLAFHGSRAKDKSFNCELITDFQQGLKNIQVVQQDIGRVLLNVITNAFHTVTEKKQALNTDSSSDYKPTVSVKTFEKDNSIVIEIKDNGNGIPKAIIDKIFQPFYTTKPTGQGTGLGLSLSYDIMKAHGGELKVVTLENIGRQPEQTGSTFIIELPLTP